MTAPALPGAAPDPARLPPEVEKPRCPVGWCDGSGVTGLPPAPPDGIDSYDFCPVCRPEEFAEWHQNTNLARALGGDGEPVAWAVFAGQAEVPVAIFHDRDVARTVADSATGRHEGYRVVPLRPAATGDTGEVEKARAKVVDAAIALRMADAAYVALHTSVKDDDDALQEARGRLDHLHAARMNKRFDLDAYTTELLAATGGPDAR